MKAKISVLLVFIMVLNGYFISTASAQPGKLVFGGKSEVITELNYNLDEALPTIDPSLTTRTPSIMMVEQLFIGLVDLDDETSQIKPELATSWTLTGGTVLDFTLRNDAYWSNGTKITAQDVRYGILRALEMPVDSNYAYVLYPILNAEAYHTGLITNPDLVGIEAITDTHLRITLKAPNSQFLSVLGLWVARPLPKTVIDTWGDQWTEPEHIVTSGAYLLKEWVVDDHILLEKNPDYFDAANVQITKVNVTMVDAETALTMYQNGNLDTVVVPYGTTIDPIIQQEVSREPKASTYYYGMNTSLAPFNNVLVRKAFSAAIDRRGLIRSLGTGYPAITFTPHGVFGYVNGYEEGIGLPYDPAQARAYLAQAGYPGGQNLPTITLAFNNNGVVHQDIAQYIHDCWLNVLGVDVQLQSYDWEDYLNRLAAGEFQIWRLGWGADYLDAYNFLHDGLIVNQTALGNWNNFTYWNLLNQASLTTDQLLRQGYFKQAEEILVETDAVVAPIYFQESITATKPYLELTNSASAEDFSTWRITAVTEEISTDTGGTLVSNDGEVQVSVPGGAFGEDVVLIQRDASGNPPQNGFTSTGQVFDISAYNQSGDGVNILEGQSVTMQVSYEDEQTNFIHEDTLSLYYWDETTQSWIMEPSTIDTENNLITANPTHFSLWAVIGESYDFVYLPMLTR
ncbi:MAG: hypothetical protein CL609_16790 [Anaerolineaceae bacterium]|nr:hypothetical protein [Anaerolineaceae bacterium]